MGDEMGDGHGGPHVVGGKETGDRLAAPGNDTMDGWWRVDRDKFAPRELE